jgi:hypothetical protein
MEENYDNMITENLMSYPRPKQSSTINNLIFQSTQLLV